MRCVRCGATMTSTHASRPYTEIGLSNVMLIDVEIRSCSRCRARELVTPNIETLHRLIARAIAGQQGALTPQAIRFLRIWLDLSCDELARVIGVRRETAFRWERRDALYRMTPGADRLLRLLVLNHDPVEQFPLPLFSPAGVRTAPQRRARLHVLPDPVTGRAIRS